MRTLPPPLPLVGCKPYRLVPEFRPLNPSWTSIIRPDKAYTSADYQYTGSCAVILNKRHYLCDDMGLGKTKMAIDAQRFIFLNSNRPMQRAGAHQFANSLARYLTICKGGGVDSFADEYALHFPEATVIKFNVGPVERRKRLYDGLSITTGCVIFLIGYENFSSMIDEFSSEQLWDWIVVDEAHQLSSTPLNNGQAKRAQNIHRVHAVRQTAMSGTPIPNLPQDAFNVNQWMGFDNRSWPEFKEETLQTILFAPVKRKPGFKLEKITNFLPEGLKKLNDLACSGIITQRTKDDELDLPPAIYTTRMVQLNAEERRRYNIVVGELVEQANGNFERESYVERNDGELDIVNPLNRLDRLLQITSSIETQTGEPYVSSKIKECIDIFDEVGDQKVIIFSRFIPALRGLFRAFKKYNPAHITGATSTQAKRGGDSDRRLMEKKFQNDESCRVFLGSTSACKEQMTLTAGSVVVFVDRLWVPKYNEQAAARARRIGTTKAVSIITLEAARTADQYLTKRLAQKEELTDGILEPRMSLADFCRILA